MTKRTRVLVVLMALLLSTSIFAQVGFKLPFVNNALPGQTLNLPVQVVNFDSVFSIQFAMQWDPEVLQFEQVLLGGNPLNLDSARFNTNQAANGILRFNWFSSYKSFANGTTIFRLQFKVVGITGTSSPVIFTEITTPPAIYFEVIRGAASEVYGFDTINNLTPLLTHGFVAVGYTVGTDEPAVSELSEMEVRVAPNPFSSTTTVRFFLPKSTAVRCWITDAAGKICYEKESNCPAGKNGMVIEKGMLRDHGIYFLHLSTDETYSVQPIVFQ